MPRDFPVGFRQAIESPASGVVGILFIDIEHPELTEPIRLVSDSVNYIFEGNKYLGGMPFSTTHMPDQDDYPRATITVQNIDRRISEVILHITAPPIIKMRLISSDDFEDTVNEAQDAKLPIGTPTVIYNAARLRLRSVTGDSLQIQGELSIQDPTVVPYPSIRATPDLLPGLFR